MSKSAHRELTIVSGGQTGVDRAALDAALAQQIPCGGWCPAGRQAEDGPIDAKYPVTVLPGAGYRQRTRENVAIGDGTLIIYFRYLTGGSANTAAHCVNMKKPMLLIDAAETSEARAAQRVGEFVHDHRIHVLNVAGPRASGEARGYDYCFNVMMKFLR